MPAILLDGKQLASRLKRSLHGRAAAFQKARRRPPCLAVVVWKAPEAESYLHSILRSCAGIGIQARAHLLKNNGRAADALKLIELLGRKADVDAILVERPLPRGLNAETLSAVLPGDKDAEGLSNANYARFFFAKNYGEMLKKRLILPCSAAAVARLLIATKVPMAGLHAVVIGRSSILGRPVAHFLSSMDSTVTLAHSRTRNLPGLIRQADVVVACLGRPRFIKGSWIKPGAIVIDAGINAQGSELVGDVDVEAARGASSHITPVPGGVGPITTAILLAQTMFLAEKRARIKA